MRAASTTTAAALVVLAACTAQPTAPAPATTAVTPAAAAAVRSNDAAYAEFTKSARSQGYRRVASGGKELWCREGGSIESRLTKQTCIAPPALAEAQGATGESRDQPQTGE